MDGMLDTLISKLMNLKYESKSYTGSGTYKYDVIDKKNRDMVKSAVVEWYDMYFGSEYARKIGELEAKVYAYEKIIANSNFAPIIQSAPFDDMPPAKDDNYEFQF